MRSGRAARIRPSSTVSLTGPDGLRGWEASRHGRRSASTLPIPVGLSDPTLKLTVLEDGQYHSVVAAVAVLGAKTVFRDFGLDLILGHHGKASVITSTFPGARAG
jgi:hypothetical protein